MTPRLPLPKLERFYDRLQELEGDQRARFIEGLDPEYRRALHPFLVDVATFRPYFERAHRALHPEPMAHTSFQFQPQSRIAHFELDTLLRRGRTSTVYAAHDTVCNRQVALKLIDLRSVRNYEEFLNEARIVAKLENENICGIRSWGFTDDDHAFLEMPLYAGISLRERLEQGPIPASELIGFLTQVASGLASAHESGVVHGDIKPENLFLEDGGRILIIDFGIARLESNVPGTARGVLKGTVPYMSPESITDPPAHFVSDIWSLGVTVYELATGNRPFDGSTIEDIIGSILNTDPPPVPSIHPILRELLSRCLVPDPAHRIGSAREILGLLKRPS